MNNVYLRGCEATYLEPLLGSSDFCEKPPPNERRFLRESDLVVYEDHMSETSLGTGTPMRDSATEESNEADFANVGISNRRGLGGGGRGVSNQGPYPAGVKNRNLGGPDASFNRGTEGSAGSLVIHIRSGDIFLPRNAIIMEPNFAGFGQVRVRAKDDNRVVSFSGVFCCGAWHVGTYGSRERTRGWLWYLMHRAKNVILLPTYVCNDGIGLRSSLGSWVHGWYRHRGFGLLRDEYIYPTFVSFCRPSRFRRALPLARARLLFAAHIYATQPPLQFYLWAIASQPWSDVSIITFSPNPKELNPTFAALETMQLSGLLGPNVDVHKVCFGR